jgi:hypothetical protein
LKGGKAYSCFIKKRRGFTNQKEKEREKTEFTREMQFMHFSQKKEKQK